MKWAKRPKRLTEKGEFCPQALPISGRFLKETLGASWHWQVGINPRQVSAISHVRSLQKTQWKMCSLGEQRTRAPSILTLSWMKESFGPRKENNCLKGPLLNHLLWRKHSITLVPPWCSRSVASIWDLSTTNTNVISTKEYSKYLVWLTFPLLLPQTSL